MTGAEALQVTGILSQLADPYVKSMEGTSLSGSEKAAAVKGIVRVLVFASKTLSPAAASLFTGVSVEQVDAIVDVAIAALVALYKTAGIFVSRVKAALS